MMVDIWSAEKSRMYGTPQMAKLAQDDQDAIQQIQCADYDQEECDNPYEQYGEDNGDICDFDGNDIQKTHKPAVEVTVGIPTEVALPVVAALGKQELPEIDDNDGVVNEYLRRTYPHQCKDGIALDYAPVEISEKWTYEQFPITCKASYKRDDNIVVKFDIKRHMWEPYQWFFQTIQWSRSTSTVDSTNNVTFCELAIIAHMLTGGATTQNQDLCIATKLMKAAFLKYHKQKFTYDGKSGSHKHTFKPNSKLKNLIFLGGEQMTGIERKPMFDTDLQNSVRAAIWRAAQLWRAEPNTHFGQGAYLQKSKRCTWKPDVMLWADTMCDINKGARAAANIVTTSVPTSPLSAQTLVPVQQICFYGHRSTSTTGPNGKLIWRKSPSTPWPHVPAGRVLCQKCYQAHRVAYESGQSQCIIDHLYTPGHPDAHANNVRQLSTTTTTASLESECEICASDIIEDVILYGYHLAWYRLGEKCFVFSHESDALSAATARPPGE